MVNFQSVQSGFSGQYSIGVNRHMMEAWRPLLFADEDQQTKQMRDPVAPAQRSSEAQAKVQCKRITRWLASA